MSNMSYCRFENTARDLQDCAENMMDNTGTHASLSRSENHARKNLLRTAAEMLAAIGMDIDTYELEAQISELPAPQN